MHINSGAWKKKRKETNCGLVFTVLLQEKIPVSSSVFFSIIHIIHFKLKGFELRVLIRGLEPQV